jgi:cyanate lyase
MTIPEGGLEMADTEKRDNPDETIRSDPAFFDLRGRQSVRATFKLSDHCIEAISIIAAQMGIKQKSLFDHLFSDTEALSELARKVSNARLEVGKKVQKTFVISRGALVSLEDIAKTHNASRDALIEMSVQQLVPIILDERKRHTKRKVVMQRIQKHLEAGREILKKALQDLGPDDPLTDRLYSAMGVYESAFKHMSAYIERSEGIESFEPEAFTKIDIVFEAD